MPNGTGVNFAPYHNRPEDVAFLDTWGTNWIKFIDPNSGKVSQVHRVVPDAQWIFRNHHISENDKQAVREDPEGMGRKHAEFWNRETSKLRNEAVTNGLSFPEQEDIWYEGINEPQMWEGGGLSYAQAVDIACRYNVSWSDTMFQFDMNALLLQLNTGHPAILTPGEGSYLLPGVYDNGEVPDYTGYDRIWEVSVKNGHPVGFHEYWSHMGPLTKDMKGWNPFRAMNFPNGVKRLNTECGLDEQVWIDGLKHHERGYKAFWHDKEHVYGLQIHEYHTFWQQHPDYLGFCGFILDYGSGHWISFDYDDVRRHLVKHVWLEMGSIVVPFPCNGVGNGPTPPEEYSPDFNRVIEFVLEQEKGYVNSPNDPGGETNWGISKRWNPDIDVKNLTREGAKEVYWERYWIPSKAEDKPEPVDLVYFDWYVQNPGAAQNYASHADDNSIRWSGDRTDWYTNLKNWNYHGKGWTRRMADVQREVAKFYDS
jgi:hypothetical protein